MPATAPQPDGLHPSICRLCLSYCPIEVEVRDGKPVSVRGDATGTPWNGFLCPKGRALPEQHTADDRLLHPLRRNPAEAEFISRLQAAIATTPLTGRTYGIDSLEE